jgi:hypothetical protein
MDQVVVVDGMLLPELVVVSADLVIDGHLHELVGGGPEREVGRWGLKWFFNLHLSHLIIDNS